VSDYGYEAATEVVIGGAVSNIFALREFSRKGEEI